MTRTTSFYDDGPLDLSECRLEPIHAPQAVQPHGVLFRLDEPDLTIQMVSESCRAVLDRTPDEVLGRPIADLLSDESVETVRHVLRQEHFAAINPLQVTVQQPLGGRTFDGIIHRTDQGPVLELEPVHDLEELKFNEFYRRVKQAVARIQSIDALDELCRVACEEVHGLTGLDRVMAYCFEPDWTGRVIAEVKADDLPAFLGRRYPATDIPEQARRLYVENRLRLIADACYEPSPILSLDPDASDGPIDLTHSVLRSTSPIHAEYLRRMDVRASMSISLVVEHRLWGLILCHHREPKTVRYDIRSSCEFLGQTLSWMIGSWLADEGKKSDRRSQRQVSRLVDLASASGGSSAALLERADLLMDLVDAAGVAICYGPRVLTSGRTPSDARIRELLAWAAPLISEDWFASERVGDVFELRPGEVEVAAGVLVIHVSKPQKHYILWFRPEAVRTVAWGTPPDKKLVIEDGRPRFSADAAFVAVEHVVRGRSTPWRSHQLRAARMLRRAIAQHELQRAAETERANEELREAAQAKDQFLATLSHELRNPLNAIVGWARLLKVGALPSDRTEHGIDVIYRNAEIQTQLIDDLLDVSRIVNGKLRLSVQPVDLAVVVREALETVRSAADAKRIEVEQRIDPEARPILGDRDRLLQVIWNLLSNAIKFTPRGGHVEIAVERDDASVQITVRDNGQGIEPGELESVFERFHQGGRSDGKGLGLGLSIVKGLVELHGGSVEARSKGSGAGSTFTVALPTSSTAPEREAVRAQAAEEAEARKSTAAIPPDQLTDLKVLVVDDNADTLQLLAEILGEAGASLRLAENGDEALAILDEGWTPDVVLSDIDMPRMDGYELLGRIRGLDATATVPAAALTAFARPQDRARAFRAGFQTHMSKPLDPEELVTVVASLGGRYD